MDRRNVTEEVFFEQDTLEREVLEDGNILEDGKNGKYRFVGYIKINPLTGLYYNKYFFKMVDEFMKKHRFGNYCMAAIDIKNFRIFNKMFGRDVGDELLRKIGDVLKLVEEEYDVIAGYLGSDNYCVILPDDDEVLSEIQNSISYAVKTFTNAVGFYTTIGVYSITDSSMDAGVMYDYASIAVTKMGCTYANRIYRYDHRVEEQLEEELRLLSDVQEGLLRDEFTFFAQPQCDIATGKIIGAESLVRWYHGKEGLIPPGVFIPALEKSGLIGELDRIVWRKVCKWIRSWIDRGYCPVPISINISRIDIISMNVTEYLCHLITEYDIPPKLLKVEITEGAYVENGDGIMKTVEALREAGFIVMMDDFGSGYSSLNMLKNISVDVLKLDMRFLDISDNNEEKGVSIIETVVNMARIMGLPIIVEGVENKKQEKFLLQLGCRYTQGFYYYKPLPIEQFEELLSDERRLDFGGVKCRQVDAMRVRELLDGNLFSDTMLNNMLGAIAFYDVHDNQIDITRVNRQYYQLTGIAKEYGTDQEKHLGNHIRDDDRGKVLEMFEKAYNDVTHGANGNLHFLRADGDVSLVHMNVFYLREKNGHKIFYGSLVDISNVEAEKKENKRINVYAENDILDEKKIESMEWYFGNMPYGFAVGKVEMDHYENMPSSYNIVYANKQMEKLCGGDVENLQGLLVKFFSGDKKLLAKNAFKTAFKGDMVEHFAYNQQTNSYFQLTFYQYEQGLAACMLRDVTHNRICDDALNGLMTSCREVYYLQLQENYFRMIYPDEDNLVERGNYEESINRHFGMGKILGYNETNIRKFLDINNIRQELLDKDSIELRYRRSGKDVVDEWCETSIVVSDREDGIPKTAVILVRSIEELIREEEKKRRTNMAETLTGMSEGFFIYSCDEDETIQFANPGVAKLYGCDTVEEFKKFVSNSFKGMVYYEDLKRIEWEIMDQVNSSEGHMDYIRYRIKRKDGSVRWIDDCGHLVESDDGSKLFYVFITDITDSITLQQQDKLITQNRFY